MRLCERIRRLLCCAEGGPCLGTRRGLSSLSPDVFYLFWRRPFWFTSPLWDQSAKLLPRSLTSANRLDHYTIFLGLHFDNGSLLKPSTFPDILGNEHSPTLIDHGLSHARSHRISGKRHKGLRLVSNLIPDAIRGFKSPPPHHVTSHW